VGSILLSSIQNSRMFASSCSPSTKISTKTQMITNENPELAKRISANGINTNYHDIGNGSPVLLIHGSGPGVSAWANWRKVLPILGNSFRVVAPDMVGFGFTERPVDTRYCLDTWVEQSVGLLDALSIDQIDVVGNSFGGAVALALAIRHPARVRRLVLMGSVGVHFTLTEGLDAVWGYTPSFENMRRIMDYFTWDKTLIDDDLTQLRYEASIRPGFQEAFSEMFPAPRQRWIETLSSSQADINAIDHETLIIHGRDDKVIPLSTSLDLLNLIEKSQLHVFGQCGHWTQIEQTSRFCKVVNDFLAE